MNNILKQIKELNLIYDKITANYSLIAKKNNLSHNSLMVLYVLYDYENCTQKFISETLQLPKSTVHSILKEFISKNILTLENNNKNKKEKFIRLTDFGSNYINSVINEVIQIESKALKQLGDDDLFRFVNLNKKYCSFFSKEVKNYVNL